MPGDEGRSDAHVVIPDRRRSYQRVAGVYETLARIYSLGSIARSKAWQVESMHAGERALYVGVGAGEDALLAARRGVDVTGVDVAPAMLSLLQRRLEREGLEAELVEGDFFDFDVRERYDVVVANYFLNVFSPAPMLRALALIGRQLRAGGRLMIADFAPLEAGWPRMIGATYYWPVCLVGALLGLAPVHPVYDYTESLRALGFECVASRGFAPLRGAPALYRSIIARRRP